MRGRVLLMTSLLLVGGAGAAQADVCVVIDEARDMLSPRDRTASILLATRQFEMAGERVSDEVCESTYVLSHIKLGNTILVTLSGPNGEREGTALGLDDLPALYSQMVRSILTGLPMSGFNVIDRTNVTAAQTSARRVQTDSFSYARLGYGGNAGTHNQGGPAIGFGQRIELDAFGIDVSFLNYQIPRSDRSYPAAGYYQGNSGASGSLLKLEGLYFLKPTANASAYVGGGLSWGFTHFSTTTADSRMSWDGSGLQGELTVGYEFPRASTLRLFVQADAGLPLYKTTGQRVRLGTGSVSATSEHRYTPSISVSVGLGWQRQRRP
jgi:hypothetical protein